MGFVMVAWSGERSAIFWRLAGSATLVWALFACGGSAFSVAAMPPEAEVDESGFVTPDANSVSELIGEASDEAQTEPITSLGLDSSMALDDAIAPTPPTVSDSGMTVDAPTHACPSTCAQLNANCGAVADTFCGGLVQCGSCTTGVCGGAAPSMCGCPSGKLACGTGCSDPMTDPANCGRCGVSCAASSVQGETCIAGVCGCGPGNVTCNGEQATYCLVAYKACF